jgi:CheY-like chemotaxis protein
METKFCLLIDDNGDDCEIFRVALAAIPGEVKLLTVKNGRDAIRQIRSGEIQPDLIFLDLNMPAMHGYEFLVYLKGQIRQVRVPVVVYSNTKDPAEVARTKKLGAQAFIEKTDCFSSLKLTLSALFVDLGILQKQPVI